MLGEDPLRQVGHPASVSRPRGITSTEEAVVRLGFRETRNLPGCLHLMALSSRETSNHGFNRQEFWLHSVATALFAEQLLRHVGHPNPEVGFTAGLIHDIGKLPFDNRLQPIFRRLLRHCSERVVRYWSAEKELMGFTHAALGFHLLSLWNFPEPILSTVLLHHDPQNTTTLSPLMHQLAAEAVFVGNIMSKAVGLGHSCDEALTEIRSRVLKTLSIMRGPPEKLIAGVFGQVQRTCRYLEIVLPDCVVSGAPRDRSHVDVLVVLDQAVRYHPIVTALRSSGFRVEVAPHYSPDQFPDVVVVVTLLQKGTPIDLMFTDSDGVATLAAHPVLRVFVLDVPPDAGIQFGVVQADAVFYERANLDLRVLLHAIDNFLGQVVLPARTVTS